MEHAHDSLLFPLVREPASRWERSGLTPGQERWFNRICTLLFALFVLGWGYSIGLRLTQPAPTDASGTLTPVFGPSSPSQLGDPNAPPTLGDRITGNPGGTGVWDVVLRSGTMSSEVPNFSVIRMVPMSAKQDGRIGRYRIGSWPCETGSCPANPIYATPPGMIEVTPENKEMFLSEHVQLKDFITKLQENVWPKYVVVDPKLLDKIELVCKELEAMGHPVTNLFAVSGFRSPWYNANGGTTSGRGQLSRHMYGDAMDIAVDNDRNGIMDDLNGDGSITLADARVIGQAVDRVEQKYPSLVGGMHYYPPTGGHRGMVHIDTRGNRARW